MVWEEGYSGGRRVGKYRHQDPITGARLSGDSPYPENVLYYLDTMQPTEEWLRIHQAETLSPQERIISTIPIEEREALEEPPERQAVILNSDDSSNQTSSSFSALLLIALGVGAYLMFKR